MIENERQYNTTKSRLADFRNQLASIEADESLTKIEKDLHINSLKGFIDDFETIIHQYEQTTP